MAKRKVSRGRGSQRKKSEPLMPNGRPIRERITNERGRTDGKAAQSASSAQSPQLPGTRKPRTGKAYGLTQADLERLPREAQCYVNGHGRTVVAIYYRAPEPKTHDAPRAERPDWPPPGWKL